MKCGLVLEGGSRRCMFTAAVLDRFMEEGIDFPYVVGVSAGAQTALNFVSKQIGRSKEIMMPEFNKSILSRSVKSTLENYMRRLSYSFSYNEFPFDFKAFFESDTVCEITATSCTTGEAVYFQEKENEKRLLDILMATASLPMIFPEIQVDGDYFVDGCIADSIPYDRAFEMGCDKAIVIITKADGELAADYRNNRRILNRMYGDKYPFLFDRLMDRYDRYTEQTERMYELEKAGKIMVIKPDHNYIWAFELSKEKLENMYNGAVAVVNSRMDEIKEFIYAK